MAMLGKILFYVMLYILSPVILFLAFISVCVWGLFFLWLLQMSKKNRRRREERIMEERRARWFRKDLERLARSPAEKTEKISPMDGAPPERAAAGLWRRSEARNTVACDIGLDEDYDYDNDYDDDYDDDDDWDTDSTSERDTCFFCGGIGYSVDDIDVFDGDPAASDALCGSCGGSGKF